MDEPITVEAYEQAKKIVTTFEDTQASDREALLIRNNQKLVGTCYKVENSSGGDETWWLYKKVVGADGTKLVIENYQRKKYRYGYPEIEITKEGYDCLFQNFVDFIVTRDGQAGYIPITEQEFHNATNSMLVELGLKRNV